MENTKLSPPWITYVNELKELFGQDPQVKIEYDDDKKVVKLFVDNQTKSDALSALLPVSKDFGNVTLIIGVVPANLKANTSELLDAAFDGNPVMSEVIHATTPFGNISYAMFKKEVVQFYNDQMDDPRGNKSMLYQDIAKDVFGNVSGAFFCTDIE